MRIVITDDCAGTGQCVAVAPEVFDLNSEGLSEVVLTPATQEQWEAAKTAADLCPMAAIVIQD
jgi:ferredoxin